MTRFFENYKTIKTYIYDRFISKVNIKIPTDKLIIYLIFIGICSLLIVNIYNSIADIQKLKILETEQAILDELTAEHKRLEQDRDYYKSSYFRQLYARERLSLGKQGQEIFLIDRGVTIDYSKDEPNPDPIQKQNFRFWWKRLIL
jgi:hypothetical protein